MRRLLKSVSSVWQATFRKDDDYVDRLSRQYTATILLCFALFVGVKQFTGKPIDCWGPSEFTESQVSYANSICWVSRKRYLPMSNLYVPEHESKNTASVNYYQWIPWILIYQAIQFILPCLIWRFLNIRSGIDISSLLDAIKVSSRGSLVETREKAVSHIVNQLDRYLLTQRAHGTGILARVTQIIAKCCCLCLGKLNGNYLVSGYMIIKTCYFLNAVGQLYVLDSLLDMDYHGYGLDVMNKWIRGQDWAATQQFPRVILCEFEMRQLSRVHNYVVQCALTINPYNEYIFIFLWFWFVFVAITTAINFLLWLFSILYYPGDVNFVRKQIRVTNSNSANSGTQAMFARKYLRQDGMFILRLIEVNMGEAVAGEIVCGLWKNYSPERKTMTEVREEDKYQTDGDIKKSRLENV